MFEQVMEEHGGTPSGRLAKVYLGRYAAADGDFARARELWNAFLEGGDNSVLAAEVRMNLLRLDLQEGKIDETVSQLEAMLDENPKVV
ncbi:MAG: tetratricopeptide repeat protein, partial [Verrucomicrobiota bacterium]